MRMSAQAAGAGAGRRAPVALPAALGRGDARGHAGAARRSWRCSAPPAARRRRAARARWRWRSRSCSRALLGGALDAARSVDRARLRRPADLGLGAARAGAERRLETRRPPARRAAPATAGRRSGSRCCDRLSDLLEIRNPYTHGHSRRVARHAERIARELGLPREQVAHDPRGRARARRRQDLHAARRSSTKPGKLTDAEFALVKRHPGDGAAMVVPLGDPDADRDRPPSPRAHGRHRLSRRPRRAPTSRSARASIAVADTFDAITSARAYRRRARHRQAIEILEREAGTQLDPVAVAAFVATTPAAAGSASRACSRRRRSG